MLVLFAVRLDVGSSAQQAVKQDNPVFQAAERAWEQDKWEQAVDQYRLFIQQNPNHPALAEAHYKIGFYLSYTASPEDSIAEYEKAIQLLPGTEIAHEAKEGIAALRYSQARYEDAQSLFVEIMRETKDWATFKESAYRLKEMTHLVALQKLPVKRSGLDCGPRSLEYACNQMGVRYASAKLKSLYEVRGTGVTLKQLRDAAHRAGLNAWGVRVKSGQLDKVTTPFIAHLRNHYWVVTKVASNRVDYFDPDGGATYLTTKLFLERWRGDALVFGKKRPSSLTAQLLSESEMAAASGGHHLHGNNLGGRGENWLTRFMNFLCHPFAGLPSVSVNVANYNLVVEDTDFNYGGRGPRVRFTRTFNNDDAYEGVFGRGWTFNYNIFLDVDVRGNVNIKREGGKLDFFKLRGDGTYDPPLWNHDKLVKNLDGTYRLEIKRARQTQHFNLKGRLARITDRSNNAVTFDYDANDRLISITDAVGRVSRLTYNARGLVAEITDPLGRKATFDYDDNKNLTTYADMVGNLVKYTYDERSYMTALTTPRGTTQFRSGTSPYFNDVPFVLKEIIDPLGNRTEFDTGNEIAWVTDARGRRIFYFNDSDGQTAEIEDQTGAKTQFDFRSGNLVRFTDSTGIRMDYTYDENGNLLQSTDAASSRTKFQYDANNYLIKIEPPIGRAITIEYDAQGNLKKLTDPKTGSVSYQHDNLGQLMEITDARQNMITFTYDDKGNRTSLRLPLSSASYSYDAVGRLKSLTDPSGKIFTYEYDGIDRVTKLQSSDGTTRNFSYECCGLKSVTDSSGTVSFERDQAGRLTKFTDINRQAVSYAYDQNSNLTRLTYPDGKLVRYSYDPADRMVEVMDWLNNTTRYDYDQAGRVSVVRNSNGTRTNYRYDRFGRPASLVNLRADGTIIAAYEYATDVFGNRVETQAVEPVSVTLTPRTTNYSHDQENRVTSQAQNAITHDSNGDLTAISGSNARLFAYDSFNRLTSATSSNTTTTYKYDGLGNRIARQANGQQTNFLVSPNPSMAQVLGTADQNNAVKDYYVYGLGLISKVTPAGQSYFYHYDGTGSTVAMTDGGASIVNRYAYDPFGKPVGSSVETVPNVFKYVGRYGVATEEGGLVYMKARYYLPELGRFTVKDPIGLRSGENLYAYAGNNPITRIDPLGLWYLDLNYTAVFAPIIGDVFAGYTAGIVINGDGLYYYHGPAFGSPNIGPSLTFSPCSPTVGTNRGVQLGGYFVTTQVGVDPDGVSFWEFGFTGPLQSISYSIYDVQPLYLW